MPVLSCPDCSTRVRVPDRRAQIRVTCPNCKREWLHPETVEFSDVACFCSRTGQPFTARYIRVGPQERFRLKETFLPSARPERSGPPASITHALNGSDSWLGSVAKGFGLSRRDNARTPAIEPERPIVKAQTEHSAYEHDWSDFGCPACDTTGSWHTCNEGIACAGATARTPEGQLYCLCVRAKGERRFISGVATHVGDSRSQSRPESRPPRGPGGRAIGKSKNAELPPSNGSGGDPSLPPPRKL